MAELLIDTGAIRRNYSHFTQYGRVIPVLKEDGYGMGAAKLLELLREKEGVTLFACSRTEEALSLAGRGADILLLSCEYAPALLAELAERDVILAVESLEQARQMQALGKRVRVHIAVDTGLGRFGFLPEQADGMRALFSMESLAVEGIFSHLAGSGKEVQLARFTEVLDKLEGYPVGLRHIASTHSAPDPRFRLDAVRIGSGLTGLTSGLERAATLTGRICTIRRLKKGSRVSYSGVRLKRDSDVAIVDVGTGDGAFTYRTCGPRTWLAIRRQAVELNGKSAPLLGFAGLTHTAVNVTGIPCQVGDRVTVRQTPVMVSGSVPRRYIQETE